MNRAGSLQDAPPIPKADLARPDGPQPDPGTSRATPAVALFLVFLAASTAGLAFHRVYGLRSVAAVVVAAAAVPVLISPAAARRRARTGGNSPAGLWRSLILTVAAWPVFVWVLLYREQTPDAALLRTLGTDLLDAPHLALTVIAPVPAEGPLLILPFTVVWLAAYAAAELVLRTRTVLVPLLPPFAVLGLAVVLGAGAPGANAAAAGVFAAVCGIFVATRNRGLAAEPAVTAAAIVTPFGPGPRRPTGDPAPAATPTAPRSTRHRMSALAWPLAAAQALLAAVYVPALTGVGERDPFSPRTKAAAAEPQYVTGGNPLDLVGAWLADPDRPLFQVRTDGSAPDVNAQLADQEWRLAVLGRFDGISWTPEAMLRPTGGRIPEDPERGTANGEGVRLVSLDQQVTVQQLGGVWLPAADRAARIEGLSVPATLAVDPDSGALAGRSPLHEGDVYRVESHVPVFDPQRIQFASAADDPRYTRMPDAPTRDLLRRLAQEATAGSSFPYQQALRLAAWLRGHAVFDPAAVPGHTYRNLEFFLMESKRGTSEQFAAAFAAMARTLGLPARVVVGFRHGRPEAGGWQVTGADAVAWPEIEFAGVGWVPFHPTPDGLPAAPRQPSPAGPQVPTGTTATGPLPQPTAPEAIRQPGGQAAPPGAGARRLLADQQIIEARHDEPAARPADRRNGDDGKSGADLLRWGIGAAALLAAAAAAVVLGKLLRPWVARRRERRGDPGAQLVAAWRRIGDHLHRAGMPDPATLTAEEVAAFGAGLSAQDPPERGTGVPVDLSGLAELVNAITYADFRPDRAQAADAWHRVDEVGRAVRTARKMADRAPG
ncbi:DUF3488 and transglutaminase-like domain-containing protein [Yinghuangia soli]|uniref:TransglutaminaseTgpA domain-containing protein n=1 Tax=Yinghuangia soli TaxID=2908204 RepID=A0AA41U025_9ACTN|nr:transglutaminase domain-containing protein [Yinghuangia soli]MCF2528121.1 transglutaminaseTgpA domain-containing protein [Yinghuangia soli]